ncbi:hypothetical protein J2W94_002473 [Pseudoxanthomonas sacheonensis]|uniref:Transposase n=1 Tax=Pseudoxanthomonas sacheonensis TaxID=443615 RepID=A0ABU1RVQ5_9GAMM|nr:hypothetical protein [Pseudoxanthomonas sacheonensis]
MHFPKLRNTFMHKRLGWFANRELIAFFTKWIVV